MFVAKLLLTGTDTKTVQILTIQLSSSVARSGPNYRTAEPLIDSNALNERIGDKYMELKSNRQLKLSVGQN